jgi:hypothetical protein
LNRIQQLHEAVDRLSFVRLRFCVGILIPPGTHATKGHKEFNGTAASKNMKNNDEKNCFPKKQLPSKFTIRFDILFFKGKQQILEERRMSRQRQQRIRKH